METYLERIIKKKKTFSDYIFVFGTVVGFFILSILSVIIFSLTFGLFIIVGLAYLAYRLITGRNIEYEYIITNADIDFDKIIDKRKRKRVFSTNCKSIEIMARVYSEDYERIRKDISRILDFTSYPGSTEAFFAVVNDEGKKTMILFEPNERMLSAIKSIIHRKLIV